MLKVLRAVCLSQIDVAEEQKRGRAAVFQLTVFHGRCEDGRGCCCLKPGVTKIYRLDDLFSMTQNERLSEVGGQRSLVPQTSVGLEVFLSPSGGVQVECR